MVIMRQLLNCSSSSSSSSSRIGGIGLLQHLLTASLVYAACYCCVVCCNLSCPMYSAAGRGMRQSYLVCLPADRLGCRSLPVQAPAAASGPPRGAAQGP
jgi:hypothetical protein